MAGKDYWAPQHCIYLLNLLFYDGAWVGKGPGHDHHDYDADMSFWHDLLFYTLGSLRLETGGAAGLAYREEGN